MNGDDNYLVYTSISQNKAYMFSNSQSMLILTNDVGKTNEKYKLCRYNIWNTFHYAFNDIYFKLKILIFLYKVSQSLHYLNLTKIYEPYTKIQREYIFK